jgi:hypothetical protein
MRHAVPSALYYSPEQSTAAKEMRDKWQGESGDDAFRFDVSWIGVSPARVR